MTENGFESVSRLALTVVPERRPIGDFSSSPAGTDLVIFDADTLGYHTLNPQAQAIWSLCDGRRTLGEISDVLRSSGSDLPLEIIAISVDDLAAAKLLKSNSFQSRVIDRRSVLAGVGVGGLLLPLISSITAPVNAATSGQCQSAGYPGPPCEELGYCKDEVCNDFCRSSGRGNCWHCDNSQYGGCCNCYPSDSCSCI
ncbi:MAG: PqqD family protein [Thermomicrobiales bacterium]|nr:PqqD family protein [Thermomicrobiales bacterium]